MSHVTVRFPEMEWHPGTHPLERKKSDPGQRMTLLEFAPGFADSNWCSRGHFGYVMEGSLWIEFEGSTDPVRPGEGFIIEPGTRHRASNPGVVPVRLLILSTEDDRPKAS